MLRGVVAFGSQPQLTRANGWLHSGAMTQDNAQIEIVTGYVPGVLGRVTQLHAGYYARHYGFGSVFERKVAAEMAEFLGRIESPLNQVFTAMVGGNIVGSVSLDGEDLGGHVAHLRWFILSDGARGRGIGNQLMTQAMAFVDAQQFLETQLWTFRGLDAARALYERHGFALVDEKLGQQWGTEVSEQKFARPAPQ